MSDRDTPKRQRSEAEIREDRLKQALKANLARRKAQSRGRQAEATGKESTSDAGDEQEG